MDASTWDARYEASDLVWGTGPNRFVAEELGSLPPGRALDLACGEGRNAIWLATQGWQAVGVDFSSAAVQRAQRLAADAGVGDRARFEVGDVVAGPLPHGPYDAVVVAYLQLPVAERRKALRGAAGAVASGGTLLVVAHDSTNLTEGVGGPQDPDVLYTAADVLADLGDLADDFDVERAEPVRREVQTPDGERTAVDALVRLRRATAPT